MFDLPKIKLVEGIAELFHQVFCLKDRKMAVTDHVWALFGVGAWISLPSWTIPSCWPFWGVPLNFFCCFCSRLWTRGALGTILHCGVMEAWGNTRDFVCFAVLFSVSAFPRLSGTALRDLNQSKFMKYAELLLWYFIPRGPELYLCLRIFSCQVWCVWCPPQWVAWRHGLLWHGHPHLCLLKPRLGR